MNAAQILFVDPIVRKELFGVSRRWTTYLGRSVYVTLLGIIVWIAWQDGQQGGAMEFSEYSRFSHELFAIFSVTQLAMVALMASVQGSDMVSKEMRAGTLGLLLLTALGPRQIVWGKWKSCAGYLGILVLAGLPVLSIAVYLGGVRTGELVAVLGLTLSTAAFGIAFALFVSSFFRGGAGALVASVLGLLAYGLVPIAVAASLGSRLKDSAPFLMFQNPLIMMLALLKRTWEMPLGDDTWMGCCGIVLSLASLLILLTASRLQSLAVADRKPDWVRRLFAAVDRLFTMRTVLGFALVKRRKQVWGHHPYLWKEFHTRLTGKLRSMVAICTVLVALLVMGVYEFADDLTDRSTMVWPVGTMMTLLFLTAIGAGSGSFSKEREERQWDVLLSIPVKAGALIGSKLAGAFLSVLPLVLVMLLFLLLPLYSWRNVGPFVPVYVSSFMFALFLTMLGMFLSMRCRTTRKAFAITLGIAFGLVVGLPVVLALTDLVAHTGWMIRGRQSGGDFILEATNPFAYLAKIQGTKRFFNQTEMGPVATLCYLYGGLSGVMIVNLVRRFDAVRYRE